MQLARLEPATVVEEGEHVAEAEVAVRNPVERVGQPLIDMAGFQFNESDTLGHCGVAIRQEDRWLLHVGDAYYLRVELTTDDHPVALFAAQRADDDAQRRASLEHLRRLVRDHGDEVDVIGYHDLTELPAHYPLPR